MGLVCTAVANEGLIISEFMANKGSSRTTRVEGQTVRPDWIEIYNGDRTSVNLDGWYLTDDEDNLTKWRFPRIILSRDEYIIVFASEKEQKYNPNNYPYFDGTYYHANFELNRDGEYLALVQPDGMTIVHEYWPRFPRQSGFVSYGKCTGNDEYGYFENPTPRAPNAATCLGDVVADTKFSQDRGFYDAPFVVTITTETEGATIRYTTDGSTPTETHGRTYTGPITVSTTTCLRAMAYKRDMLPTNVDTQTYIFPEDVRTQDGGLIAAKYPRWDNNYGDAGVTGDYEMDPDVVGDHDRFGGVYRNTIVRDLQTIPTLSLVMDAADWFDRNRGIYANPKWSDRYDEEAERVVSVEYFDPCHADTFQIDAVIRTQGGSGISSTWKSEKLSFRLKFQEPYGPTKLEFPLFADMDQDAAERFDTLILDSRMNTAWHYQNPGTGQNERAQYARDQYTSDLQYALGGYGHHGRHVHLYLNGLYWGLYNVHERPDHSFAAEMFGGDKKEYHAIKKSNATALINDGYGLSAWSSYDRMLSAARDAGNNPIDPAKWQILRERLDVDNLIALLLARWFLGDVDWGSTKNWYATGYGDPVYQSQWRYHSWDAEKCMYGLHDNKLAISPDDIHNKLRRNVEYKMCFADHIYKQLVREDGALTAENAAARYLRRLEKISRAVVAESARWGDNRRSTPYTRGNESPYVYGEWLAQRNWLLNSYFPQRTGIVLNQFKSAGLYPNIDPPEFSQYSGQSLMRLTLSMSNPNGSGYIYYTTDGTDPRRYMTGNPVGTRYTHSITFTASAHVKARVRSGVTWSALNETIFSVGPVAESLRITEIMYNPLDTGQPDDPNREFIELKNIGPVALNLNLVRFTDGIDFTFPNVELAPNEYILVVKELEVFTAQYGADVRVAGEYSGSLSNSGERIVLEDAAGQTIHDFSYQDNWYDITDGEGFSLTIKDPTNPDLSQWDIKDGWRASIYLGGSPGWDDAEDNPAQGKVVINELLAHAHAEAPDWIELYNTTSIPVDIGGWFLSDSKADPMKYEVAAGTLIEPFGYMVFFEDLHFGNPADPGSYVPFALSENGETLYLNAGRDGMLTEYSDEETFGASETSVAFGRHRKSTGTYNFVAMSVNTPGSENAYPKVGPIVISEIMYNPASGEQDEEYIELLNISSSYVILAEYDDENLVEVPWMLTDDSNGINFDFPIDTMLAPDERLLIVKDRNIFQRAYPTIPNNVRIVEWGAGRLNNAGEKVQLSKPGDQVEGTRYYIRMDRVNYSDGSHPAGEDPWPIDPDGFGSSLTRKHPSDYGNDPENWIAADPSPGR